MQLTTVMNVYALIAVTFSIVFAVPIVRCVQAKCNSITITSTLFVFLRLASHYFVNRWLYINYLISIFCSCFKAALTTIRRLATRKSKFQQEVDKIVAQYAGSSEASELQV